MMLRDYDVDRFRAAIAARMGLAFDESRRPALAEVLLRRLESTQAEPDTYLATLETRPSSRELQVLAAELTVPETYFFRHADQFSALADVVIPERMAARRESRRLEMLSLGCASGEEAYSMAMRARDAVADAGWEVRVRGLDINAVALEKASRGRYTAWALRETPEADRRRWFRPDARDFILEPALLATVQFEIANLVEGESSLSQQGVFDVIFCRNVLMYFSVPQAQAVVARMARAIAPGGYLFLGHAETLRGLSNDFHLCHTHGTFYYQRKPQVRSSVPQRVLPEGGRAGGDPVLAGTPHAVPDADAWFTAIRRASDRVAALTSAHGRAAAPSAAAQSWDRARVFDLMRREQYRDALSVVDAVPAEQRSDPDTQLVRAVLLANAGEIDEAERACHRLLERDDLSAGAHYLLALCREGAGDAAAAVHHSQAASYLDPTFAMPRLHLGVMARRAGDRATARRELTHARLLLEREDASRVLLFGGGFSRDALVALCRTELARAGGRS